MVRLDRTFVLLDREIVVAKCDDCGKPYKKFKLDTMLSDEQWLMVHPEKNGLLCASCMVKRAERLPGVILARMEFIFYDKNDPEKVY
jgi:hypothetical protein